jgi:hypothetical protein
MSNYYLGTQPESILKDNPRYFYGLRRNINGSLFFVKSDQLYDDEDISINNTGKLEDNFKDFESGVDFYEGINVNHEAVFKNLKYTQYRWDDRSVLYYINDEGELVLRINKSFSYEDDISED